MGDKGNYKNRKYEQEQGVKGGEEKHCQERQVVEKSGH